MTRGVIENSVTLLTCVSGELGPPELDALPRQHARFTAKLQHRVPLGQAPVG